MYALLSLSLFDTYASIKRRYELMIVDRLLIVYVCVYDVCATVVAATCCAVIFIIFERER